MQVQNLCSHKNANCININKYVITSLTIVSILVTISVVCGKFSPMHKYPNERAAFSLICKNKNFI